MFEREIIDVIYMEETVAHLSSVLYMHKHY